MPRRSVLAIAVGVLAVLLLIFLLWRSSESRRDSELGQTRDAAAESAPRGITAFAVLSASDVAGLPKLERHQYRIHLIDVGTGLAILVQGQDFNLLFDGGSRDDKRGLGKDGSNSRLLAYLYAAIGASGPAKCRPTGDVAVTSATSRATIDHLILSHPHEDHGNYFDEVLFCYPVKNVWDVGVVNDAKFYKQFLSAVAAEPGVRYHTVAAPSANGYVMIGKKGLVQIPLSVWAEFKEGLRVKLDAQADFIVLNADATERGDFNQNSIVLRVRLGAASLLLTGDAESGSRDVPGAKAGGIEAHLMAKYPEEIDVDILQVGHHGSKTSSRSSFLEAVSPAWALLSSGPRRYHDVLLPDVEVVDALRAMGAEILRTDLHDADLCPELDRIGVDDDRPGGCDNFVLEIR